MLKALYDYAVSHDLTVPPGYSSKTVKAWISLSQSSDYVGVHIGDDTPVIAPDIGSKANGTTKSNVIVEKRSVILPEKANAKSEFYLSTLKEAANFEPRLSICVKALESSETCDSIRKALDREKIKEGDRISFMIDGVYITDSDKLRPWWDEYRKQFEYGDHLNNTLCLITGRPTSPMTTAPSVKGLKPVGGHASGDALICFDKSAFCSYDLKQAANAPVSEEAYAAVRTALDSLLEKAPILAGMKFVHWYDHTVPEENDPLVGLFDLGEDESIDEEPEELHEETVHDELTARQKADRTVKSLESGQSPESLDRIRYHILLLTGVGGRIMIRRYEQGNYEDLRHAVDMWNDDLRLINSRGTGDLPGCKLTARFLRLLKPQKADKKPLERAGKELSALTSAVITAIINGNALPDPVACRALASIRSDMFEADNEAKRSPTGNPRDCQWLKVYLLRKERNDPDRKKEEYLMNEYNEKHPCAAYHCGAIMALYEAIQKKAMPNANSGVVQRFYASASQTPALVFGRLAVMANHHFDKIENKYIVASFKEKLQKLYCAVGGSIPVTLTLEEQSYFALGYYQMCALLNNERAERAAKNKENNSEISDENVNTEEE